MGFARTKKVYGGSYSVVASDISASNQVAICIVPKDFVVQSISGTFPDLDTGTTITASIGDSGNAARLVNASTAAQTGGAVPAIVAGTVGYQFPVDTEILLSFGGSFAGAQAGSGTFFMEGYIGP
jgi:hypothetical protein